MELQSIHIIFRADDGSLSRLNVMWTYRLSRTGHDSNHVPQYINVFSSYHWSPAGAYWSQNDPLNMSSELTIYDIHQWTSLPRAQLFHQSSQRDRADHNNHWAPTSFHEAHTRVPSNIHHPSVTGTSNSLKMQATRHFDKRVTIKEHSVKRKIQRSYPSAIPSRVNALSCRSTDSTNPPSSSIARATSKLSSRIRVTSRYCRRTDISRQDIIKTFSWHVIVHSSRFIKMRSSNSACIDQVLTVFSKNYPLEMAVCTVVSERILTPT